MHEQLPYLRSLGIGALILKGVFDVEVFPLNLTAADKKLCSTGLDTTSAQ